MSNCMCVCLLVCFLFVGLFVCFVCLLGEVPSRLPERLQRRRLMMSLQAVWLAQLQLAPKAFGHLQGAKGWLRMKAMAESHG